MLTIPQGFGGHHELPSKAMTKHEVAAVLCHWGFDAGFWSVPEYNISGLKGSQRSIDVVWALRLPSALGRIWRPIAAFEIEGHNVNLTTSVLKNADSLSAAANAGAVVQAMVLFQVGPDGRYWGRPFSERYHQRVKDKLYGSPCELGSRQNVELLLDEKLETHIETWVAKAKSEKQRLLTELGGGETPTK